ncbi:MAG: DUF1573 domain-containing protein [Bacteroidales bacterium]|jgi:hypothetical protein
MRYISVCCLLLLGLTLTGQEREGAVLSLENNSHDFGRVWEDKGKVSHTFTFSNTGDLPLVVNNVRTTCGCTVPKWSSEPVLPGKQGSLTVEFDPENRQGLFHKTVQLQSSAINSSMFVTITGSVVPPLNKERLEYRVGELSVKSRHINFGYIFKGKTAMQTLTIANNTDKPMSVEIDDVPEHLIAYIYPSVLQPGEYGQIEILYNSNLLEEWDVVIDRLRVIINGEEVKKNKLAVTANIREDFRKLTEDELANAPVAHFEVKDHDFGTIGADKPVKCSFVLKNTGNTDLVIRALKPSCGCTVAKLKRKSLSPGEQTKIEAEFDPEGRSGEFKNAIAVITNDPKDYKQYLSAEGYIKQ